MCLSKTKTFYKRFDIKGFFFWKKNFFVSNKHQIYVWFLQLLVKLKKNLLYLPATDKMWYVWRSFQSVFQDFIKTFFILNQTFLFIFRKLLVSFLTILSLVFFFFFFIIFFFLVKASQRIVNFFMNEEKIYTKSNNFWNLRH